MRVTLAEDTTGVSPVVGSILMVALVMLLAGILFVGVQEYSDEVSREAFDDAVRGQGDATEAPYGYREIITTDNHQRGATTKHAVTLEVTGDAVGNSLNQVTIDYEAAKTNVSAVPAGDELENLQAIGIDTDGDGRIDKTVKDDIEKSDFEANDGGSTLKIELSGNYNLGAGDYLVVVYTAVENPNTSGMYDVEVNLNGDKLYNGSLDIE